MKTIFEFGHTVQFSELPNNSIALDGYVQGPYADAANRKFSFDHHAGCIRLVTLATCQQVLLALDMGLVVDSETQVFSNAIDADTVLALWLLRHPEQSVNPKVRELVSRIGLTDAHGPIFVPHPINMHLGPLPWVKEVQTAEKLEGYIGCLDRFFTGEFNPKEPERKPSKGWGWKPGLGWTPLEAERGFESVYKAGYYAGVLYNEAPHNTITYTVAKRSDLVPMPVGPAEAKPGENTPLPTILGELFKAELAVPNTPVTAKSNWGGGTSIGGSPRLPDGSASRLELREMHEVLQRFV